MAEQIKDLLLPWSNGMNAVQKNFDALANSTDSLKMQGEQIEAEVMNIIGSFCPDAVTCANNTMSDFKKQGERACQGNQMNTSLMISSWYRRDYP
jgi:hypothetical protein